MRARDSISTGAAARAARWGTAAVATPLAALVLILAGCAGATIGSGVGDRLLEHPPYHAGSRVVPPVTDIGHLPIAYQRGATDGEIFDPRGDGDTPLAALLAEMNAYLDSLGLTARIDAGPIPGTPPDVRFGCDPDATGDCTGEGMGIDGKKPWLMLAVGRPSSEWIAWAGHALQGAGVGHALVLTLEVGQYWPRQKNWRGQKEVELGTDYAVGLPWLTSLESPIRVIQLTGALIGRDGRAVRIGAEGLLARRTDLVMSGFGAQALIRDDDVERLRSSRRDDLPGRPLVWQAGLRNLVAGLTGRAELAVR